MSRRGSYRRHSAEFKLQVCTDIRSGKVGRLESQELYSPSANLIQHWLVLYDRGELRGEEVEAAQSVPQRPSRELYEDAESRGVLALAPA